MPQSKQDTAELLALAATQLDKATAATTHLLDKNDAHVAQLAERVAVLETQMGAVNARLKRIDNTIHGTLTDKGLKERYTYVETEVTRLVQYMASIDSQLKGQFFQDKEAKFSRPSPYPPTEATPTGAAVVIAIVAAIVGFSVLWYVQTR